jgi:multiple sugar transport system substrate-binding protein
MFLNAMSTPESGAIWVGKVYEPGAMKTTTTAFSGPHGEYLTQLLESQKDVDPFIGMPLDLIQNGGCKDAFGQVLNKAFPGGLISVDETTKRMDAACYGK